MRCVSIKSEEAQAVLTLDRAKDLLASERVALSNQIRELLGEVGIVVATGMGKLRVAIREIQAGPRVLPAMPAPARTSISKLYEPMLTLQEKAVQHERKISALARQSEAAKRLMQMEGVSPMTATALLASVGNAKMFRNGRECAAWRGLLPRQHWNGGKSRLGGITKWSDARGDVVHVSDSWHAQHHAVHGGKSRWPESMGIRTAETLVYQCGRGGIGSKACPDHVGHAGAWNEIQGTRWPLEGQTEKRVSVFDRKQRTYPTKDCGQDGLLMNGVGLRQASA